MWIEQHLVEADVNETGVEVCSWLMGISHRREHLPPFKAKVSFWILTCTKLTFLLTLLLTISGMIPRTSQPDKIRVVSYT